MAAVVVTDGNLLLVRRRDNGEWEPPGGALETAERIEQGVVREVDEEAGVEVRPVRLAGIYKNMPHAVITLVFRCDFLGGTPRPSPETPDATWVPLAEMASYLNEGYRTWVLDSLGDGPPAVRLLSGTFIGT